jgi:hypothetical protein
MDQIFVDYRRGLEGRVCEQVVRRALVVGEFGGSVIANVLHSFTENGVVCQLKKGRHQIITSVFGLLSLFCVEADIVSQPEGLIKGDSPVDLGNLLAEPFKMLQSVQIDDILLDRCQVVDQLVSVHRLRLERIPITFLVEWGQIFHGNGGSFAIRRKVL